MISRLTIVLSACIATTVAADIRNELFKLVPEDNERLDVFGLSVELRNRLALVGAGGDNSVYLFDVSDPLAPQQIFKLRPTGLRGGRIGGAMAMNDSHIVLGASADDVDGEDAGAALIFDLATGEQLARLQPQNPVVGAHFGTAVDIWEDLAFVGARSDNFSFENNYGAVHIFDVSDPRNPVELAKILPPEDFEAQSFGESLAVDDRILAIGTPRSQTAFVYDITNPESPSLVTQLIPDVNVIWLVDFGISIETTRNLVAVADTTYQGDQNDSGGAVFLFDSETGEQRSMIVPNDGIINQNFGVDISLDGATLAIGAQADDDNGFLSGSAYIFDIEDPAAPAQIAKLLPSDGYERQSFGISIAVVGGLAIVGSDINASSGAFGAAYLFDASLPCPADLDCDLDADADDFFLYLDAFAAGNAEICDLNQDGECDASDFFAFLDLFAQPCP